MNFDVLVLSMLTLIAVGVAVYARLFLKVSQPVKKPFAYRVENSRGQHVSTWPSLKAAMAAIEDDELRHGAIICACYKDGTEKPVCGGESIVDS